MSPTPRWICLTALLLGVSLGVAGAASTARQVRPVSGYSAIRLVGAIDLVVAQGTTESVSIEGDADQIREVTTTVDKGTLVISHATGGSLWSWFRVPDTAPRAVVSVKSIAALELEGSGDARVIGTLVSQEPFLARVTGSGDIRIDAIAARALEVRISGTGGVHMAGAATDAIVRIAGSGDFAGGDLKTVTCKVTISGSGDAVVWARDRLEVSVAGSGDVGYYGTPVISQSLAGSGTLKALGAKN